MKIVSRIVEAHVFTFGPSGPEFLLLRRSPGEKLYPGLWQCVTGSIEEGETASAAALREISEETGLKPASFWVVPHVNAFYDPANDTMNLSPIFAVQVEPGVAPKLSREHSEYKWCGYDEAIRTIVWPGQRQGVRILRDIIIRGETAADRLKFS